MLIYFVFISRNIRIKLLLVLSNLMWNDSLIDPKAAEQIKKRHHLSEFPFRLNQVCFLQTPPSPNGEGRIWGRSEGAPGESELHEESDTWPKSGPESEAGAVNSHSAVGLWPDLTQIGCCLGKAAEQRWFTEDKVGAGKAERSVRQEGDGGHRHQEISPEPGGGVEVWDRQAKGPVTEGERGLCQGHREKQKGQFKLNLISIIQFLYTFNLHLVFFLPPLPCFYSFQTQLSSQSWKVSWKKPGEKEAK